MIPETFGALLAFLGLIAPGLVYRTVHERRRPPRNDTTVVETSRIALTSLVFSLVSLLVLLLVQEVAGLALPDVSTWITQGAAYAAANLGRVLAGLAAQVVLACSLAAAAAWLLTRGSTSRFREDTVYGTVFRRFPPPGFKSWVYVRLTSDVEFWGYERAHDDRDAAGARVLVLDGQGLRRRQPGDDDWQPIGDSWDVVVLESDRIQFMQVVYRNEAGRLAGAVNDRDRNGRVVSGTAPPTAAPTRPGSAPGGSASRALEVASRTGRTDGAEVVDPASDGRDPASGRRSGNPRESRDKIRAVSLEVRWSQGDGDGLRPR